MTTGFFITFEGVEGCGKTTQLRLLQEYLTARGYAVTATREPGGTPIGDAIRRLVLSPGASAIDGKTELMLYEASRAQHLCEVIGPALAGGRIVLCDRFGDATLAYQGYAQGLPLDWIATLNRFASGNRSPDCTILLDCPVEQGLARTRERAARTGQDVTEDRFEHKDLDFHRRVRQGYLAIARDNRSRFIIIDGGGERDAIHAAIRTAVLDRLPIA